MSNELDFDSPISPEVRKIASKLSPEELKEIDEALLSEASNRYRKVARLVGRVLLKFKEQHPMLSDVFFSERVQSLVTSGHLDSQGDLRRMRYSEVKLSSSRN